LIKSTNHLPRVQQQPGMLVLQLYSLHSDLLLLLLSPRLNLLLFITQVSLSSALPQEWYESPSCKFSTAFSGQLSLLQPYSKTCDRNSGRCCACSGVKFAVGDRALRLTPLTLSSRGVVQSWRRNLSQRSSSMNLYALDGNFLQTQQTASNNTSIQQFCREPLKAEEKAEWSGGELHGVSVNSAQQRRSSNFMQPHSVRAK